MKPELPKLIETYVQASNEENVKTYLSCFTDTATLTDDNELVKGHEAIAEWFDKTRKKYSFKTEPLSVKEHADQILMTAKVTGTFPGSPVNFDYHINLSSGLIQNLRIEFKRL